MIWNVLERGGRMCAIFGAIFCLTWSYVKCQRLSEWCSQAQCALFRCKITCTLGSTASSTQSESPVLSVFIFPLIIINTIKLMLLIFFPWHLNRLLLDQVAMLNMRKAESSSSTECTVHLDCDLPRSNNAISRVTFGSSIFFLYFVTI